MTRRAAQHLLRGSQGGRQPPPPARAPARALPARQTSQQHACVPARPQSSRRGVQASSGALTSLAAYRDAHAIEAAAGSSQQPPLLDHCHPALSDAAAPDAECDDSASLLSGASGWFRDARARHAERCAAYRALDWLALVLPCVRWLRTYRLGYLWGDVAAGVGVAFMVVPQSLSYALLAGTGPSLRRVTFQHCHCTVQRVSAHAQPPTCSGTCHSHTAPCAFQACQPRVASTARVSRRSRTRSLAHRRI